MTSPNTPLSDPMLAAQPASADEVLVVLDTETTGLNHKTDRLLELAAVKLVNGEITDTYTTLVNPGMPIRHSSFKIHGISEDMVANEPPIETVLPDFLAFVGDAPFVAHNALFDYSFINQATKTHLDKRFSNRRIDTLDMYRSVFPEEPSHGLSALKARFGLDPTVTHRALDDAMGLAQVYPKLRALFEQKFNWQLSQLPNVPYLAERYLRIQKAIQQMQSEMSDLKEIFKLYFAEGGQPFQTTTGETLSSSYRRLYEFDEDIVWEAITAAGCIRQATKINTRAVERMIDNRRVDPDILERLHEARTAMNESIQVAFSKPVIEAAVTEATEEEAPDAEAS